MSEDTDNLAEIHPDKASEIPQKITILPEAGPEEMTQSALLNRETGKPYKDITIRKAIREDLNINNIKGGAQPEGLTNPDDDSSY